MNQQDKEETNLLKMKRNVLYWLLGIIYTAFIGLQLGRIQAIANFNYNLHEMMYAPVNLAIFVVPILFVIYIFLSIKSLIKKENHTLTLKTTIRSILVMVSLVIIFWIVGYQSKDVSTTGLYEIERKTQEDSKYYIVLEGKKIRVSQNEYKLINRNKKYMIMYVWNKSSPYIGNLKIIEPIIE